MNAAGPTAERVYEVLKGHVLHGAFKPGTRLDPAALAERVDSSVTPVRASLNILVGEGLVETGTGEGFRVPLIDEPGLRDRYGWNAELVRLALRRASLRPQGPLQPLAMGDPPRRAAALFLHLARSSQNLEHAAAIARLNDRLHAARLAEVEVLPHVESELDDLAGAVEDGGVPRLRQLLADYHRRRVRAASAILRRLYRTDDAELR